MKFIYFRTPDLALTIATFKALGFIVMLTEVEGL